MAWGEMTPEQITAKLKEAGFDAAQVNERLKTLDTVASKEEVKNLSDSLASIKDTLTTLQNTLKTQPNNEDANRSDTDENAGRRANVERQQPLNIDPLKFMEDPQSAVRQLMQESLTPLAVHSMGVAADMAYNMARQRLPYFEVFESEIKELWNKYPVNQKGKPDELIENLYYLVKGRHADEIATDTAKREGKYNLIQPGGTTVVRQDQNTTKKPEELLSEAEITQARKWGITPEEYAKSKAGLKYV